MHAYAILLTCLSYFVSSFYVPSAPPSYKVLRFGYLLNMFDFDPGRSFPFSHRTPMKINY